MIDIGIVGAGPGGLTAAWHLDNKCPDLVNVTILEASPRPGGKLLTRRFAESGLPYEAGVAEIYDYSAIGPDPLRDLIRDLGLKTVEMNSSASVIGDLILNDMEDVERAFGADSRRAIDDFHAFCARAISPSDYYESLAKDDNARPFARMAGHDFLRQAVRDEKARDYLRIMAHSDIAAPLHLTNGLNSVKNVLMDVPGYLQLRSIDGGIERLTESLTRQLLETDAATLSLGTRVTDVERAANGRYRVTSRRDGQMAVDEFDLLILALPLNWLSTVNWHGEDLRRAMVDHIDYFDRPGHYLRVSLLFERPFWRGQIDQSWWMSDAFNGCCVYDEGARHDVGSQGVLGWLIAGSDALAMANLDDAQLVEMVLDSLPASLRHGGSLLKEFAVHRWVASVNAIPGGVPCRDTGANHMPDAKGHPGLLVVGDYLFDSTINGVFDSADAATDMALNEIVQQTRRQSQPAEGPPAVLPTGRIGRAYFENYRGLGSYDEVWRKFFDARQVAQTARLAWNLGESFSILDAGSANGRSVAALRDIGLDAWGIESNRFIHDRTPAETAGYNLLGNMTKLPFPDNHFDVIYETCLAHLPDEKIDRALAELHRVAKHGVIFASVTSEQAVATLGRCDLAQGIKRLGTWWEWSERFFDFDFELALDDDDRLAAAWALVQQTAAEAGYGLEDAESLRFCFYSKMTSGIS